MDQGAAEQVGQNQVPVEDHLPKDLIDLGTEATRSSSNLNSGGAGEQALEDQAVVDAPPLKDRAAVEAPPPKDLIDLGTGGCQPNPTPEELVSRSWRTKRWSTPLS